MQVVTRLKKGDRSWVEVKQENAAKHPHANPAAAPAAARGGGKAGGNHGSPKDNAVGGAGGRGRGGSGASSAMGGDKRASGAPTPADSELSKNQTPQQIHGGGGRGVGGGRPVPAALNVSPHHEGASAGRGAGHSPASEAGGGYSFSPPKDKSPLAGRAGAHPSLHAHDSVRGSKESVKSGAGDAAGGYAGQMKAIMDAREREMQIQAKAQALEAARKARAELSYDQVKKLRHVDVETKSIRRHWSLMREAVREELLWGPGKLQELRDGVVRLVKSVSTAAAQREAAEEAARRERLKVEQLRNDMQQIRGNIRVFCRVRPPHFSSYSHESTCSYPDEDSLAVTDRDGPVGPTGKPALKRFTFDRMYTPKASQVSIYEDVKPLTMSVLDGYNCCVFAYGQTGTGKTYTMQGPANDPGVTYRAVKDLFETAERAAMHGYNFSFRISVLEIYNERIFDLLVDPRTAQERRKGKEDLAVHIDMQKGVRVEGLTEIGVEHTANVLDIIELAQADILKSARSSGMV